jgi:hypothetical protein
MANEIRIKRRLTGSAGAPSSLKNAELAFNEVDNTLYYGKGSSGGEATSIIAIAGSGIYSAGTGLELDGTVFSIENTAVTAGSYGSTSKTLSATVNAQGQLTALSAADIAIANTQVSGLGTMSVQNAGAVAITGGTIDGITIDGGTF